MRTAVLTMLTMIAAAFGASAVSAQNVENAPTQITTVYLGDMKARYLNFKWDEEAFTAIEKGGAKRSWAIARLFPDKPIVWNGNRISGGNLLILHPATGSTPMTFEVRVIDMREVWVDANVIAEPPEGRTVYTAPAQFEKVADVAERLTVALSESGGKVQLAVHYGNRQAKLQFDRQSP
jgi:hypothetical protein